MINDYTKDNVCRSTTLTSKHLQKIKIIPRADAEAMKRAAEARAHEAIMAKFRAETQAKAEAKAEAKAIERDAYIDNHEKSLLGLLIAKNPERAKVFLRRLGEWPPTTS